MARSLCKVIGREGGGERVRREREREKKKRTRRERAMVKSRVELS